MVVAAFATVLERELRVVAPSDLAEAVEFVLDSCPSLGGTIIASWAFGSLTRTSTGPVALNAATSETS